MRFQGGPRDGEEVEPEHVGCDLLTVSISSYSEEHEHLGDAVHLYLPDSFGNLVYQGLR